MFVFICLYLRDGDGNNFIVCLMTGSLHSRYVHFWFTFIISFISVSVFRKLKRREMPFHFNNRKNIAKKVLSLTICPNGMLNQLICNFATEAKERLIRTDLATHITFPNWDYEFLTMKKSSLRICYEVLEILYEIAVYRDAKHKTHFFLHI